MQKTDKLGYTPGKVCWLETLDYILSPINLTFHLKDKSLLCVKTWNWVQQKQGSIEVRALNLKDGF